MPFLHPPQKWQTLLHSRADAFLSVPVHAVRSGSSGDGGRLEFGPVFRWKVGGRCFSWLPDEGESIDSLLAGPGLATLLNTDAAQYRQIEWSIPKFAVKGRSTFVPVLQRAGVERPFVQTRRI